MINFIFVVKLYCSVYYFCVYINCRVYNVINNSLQNTTQLCHTFIAYIYIYCLYMHIIYKSLIIEVTYSVHCPKMAYFPHYYSKHQFDTLYSVYVTLLIPCVDSDK